MSATCGNCRHWTLLTEDLRARIALGMDYDGLCQGGPPTAMLSGRMVTAVFPPTGIDWSCGAWSPRVPPPEPAPQEPID